MGSFDFNITVEGEDAEKLWNVIYSQTSKDKGSGSGAVAASTEEEEESPEIVNKVDELLGVVKELSGSKEE